MDREHEVLVISQLPPPVHGSTLMTSAFLDILDLIGIPWTLTDRRFSRSVDQVGRFGLGKLFSAIGLIARLGSSLTKRRPSVVVFFVTTRSFSFLVDWLLSEVLRWFRVPVILYVHTIGFTRLSERGRTWKALVLRLLGAATEIVVLDDELSWDVESFSAAPVLAIPNTLPVSPTDSVSEALFDTRNVVLFLSNLIPGKGHEDFLYVAIRALESGVSATFVIAGAASEETIRVLNNDICAAGYEGRISYVGPADRVSKWEHFRSAKLFVFPSSNETVGLVLLEAVACGAPVVSYRTGALAPQLEKCGAARVVPEGDRYALASQVISLLKAPSELKMMSDAAYNTYQDKYSREVYAQNWARLLSNYISTQTPSERESCK